MSLDLSEFRPRRSLCAVGEALGAIDDAERDTFLAAFADNLSTDTRIAEAFQKRGHRVSFVGVTHHRKGTCRCDCP